MGYNITPNNGHIYSKMGQFFTQELERVNRILYSFSLFFSVPPRTLRDITSAMLRRFPFTSSAVRYSNFVKNFPKM